MLKDLDQRQVEQGTPIHNGNIVDVNPQKSNKKNILIIVLVVLFINIAGLYVWNLYQENQLLKVTAEQQSDVSTLHNKSIKLSQLTKGDIEPLVNKSHVASNREKTSIDKITPHYSTNTNVVKANGREVEKKPEIIENEQINNEQINDALSEPFTPSKKQNIKQVNQPRHNAISKVNAVNNKVNIQTKNTLITPIQKNTRYVNAGDLPQENENKSSLTISRSQLSPKRLAQQKVDRAERAINNNEITKAEKLFEEVLLISPEHKSARKQLGALWFGRQLYRPAVNLLSRGITLHPEDIDFRLMKARILLSQSNNIQAFNVLNGFSTANNVEYQVLLANTSQLLKRNESAILAYQQLVDMEGHKGKWWLGLAVAFDRNSQFTEAKSAYNNALIKDDLSDSSDEFIRQRLSELGE